MTEILPKAFERRDALINHVKQLAPWAVGEASEIRGGKLAAEEKLSAINPILYARTRNFGDGHITQLSPYIRHGILSLNAVRNYALTQCSESVQITKFIQELAWRDFWQRSYARHPEWIWNDIEPYKTGFVSDNYADKLPTNIEQGTTGLACIDHFIRELTTTGYIHNHACMYEQLAVNKNVILSHEEPFVNLKANTDFRRFYPYWNKVNEFAFM